MGSPDPMQIDGMGGTHIVTSKIAIISPSQREGVDVDYTFCQIGVEQPIVGSTGNCGNISAGVGPFAINEALVKAYREGVSPDGGKTKTREVRIFNTGTEKILIAHVPINQRTGRAAEKGEFSIAGCPGRGAPVLMDYRNVIGGSLRKGLLPTGRVIDQATLDGKRVSFTLVDAVNLIAFADAEDLGITGRETAKELSADEELIGRVKKLRGLVATSAGMCKDPENVDEESPMTPMITLVSKSTDAAGHVQARLFLDNKCHTAMAGSGGCASAACSRIPGSVIHRLTEPKQRNSDVFNVQHPTGLMPVSVITESAENEALPVFKTLSFIRTSRHIFKGELFIPEDFQDRWRPCASRTAPIATPTALGPARS